MKQWLHFYSHLFFVSGRVSSFYPERLGFRRHTAPASLSICTIAVCPSRATVTSSTSLDFFLFFGVGADGSVQCRD